MKREERRMERYRASFQRRFRFAAKRFCEFELKFLQATTPPTLSLLLGHNRTTSNTRCSILSCPSPSRRTFLSTAATTTRRKPIRDRHPAERQRLLVYPRSHVKMGSRSSVTQTETECNEAGDGTLFPRHFVPSLCVYIRFGIYFIYHSRLSLRGLSLSLSLSLDTLIQQYVGDEERRSWTRRKKRNERGERERPSRETRGVSLGAIQCTTLPPDLPAFQIVPFSFIHI